MGKCECGQRAHYYTNVNEPVTEVSCVACVAPVAVGWNPKKMLSDDRIKTDLEERGKYNVGKSYGK